MTDVWVVVASSTRCRIFTQSRHNAPLEELEDLVHPEGRLHDRDLASDKPGRAYDSSGSGRHGMGQPVSPTEQENIRFAKTVAERIDAGRKAQAFERLVLMADPRFLGHLRHGLSAATRNCLSTEIPKNLADADPDAIRAALPFRI
ncbi:MAG: host attachment protein [Gammaproteobacteria bacterium]|jgi:protein required for attachment to host cells